MEEVNKKPKTTACSGSDKEEDRLSDLSDELIIHILSFLTTKESYRTSVLSTRWESIYTKIPNLDFELPMTTDPMSSKVIQSVYAALLRRTENLRKLSLFSDDGCTPYDMHLWVSKALDLKVQELEFDCWSMEKPTLLPLRLSISKSLVALKLRGGPYPRLNYSSDVCFPSLKILHLQLIVFNSVLDNHSEYDLANFLSCCPHLEEFVLHDCMKQAINIVSFPSLKRAFISLFPPLDGSNVCPLQINAPSLEVLQIVDTSVSPRKYEFINLPNLDRATLRISMHPDFNSLYTLMKGISNVKSLTISSETIHFLRMENKIDNLHLLTFQNLSSFSFEICENGCWNVLVSILQNTPKHLAIEKIFETEEVENTGWVGPSETPTCLANNLITFEFIGIQNVKIFTPSSNKPIDKSLLEASNISSVLAWV